MMVLVMRAQESEQDARPLIHFLPGPEVAHFLPGYTTLDSKGPRLFIYYYGTKL